MTENNNIFGVILAGGSGSRLWPMSRELYPKQMLRLTGENTLFQSTVLRLMDFISSDNIITVTNQLQSDDIKLQLKEILPFSSKSSVIGEPIGRNTAPAIALAALYVKNNCDFDPIILVTPSDQLIQDNSEFVNAVKEGLKYAENGSIVTFGIKPTRPETGYGYIKVGNNNKVDEFKEKPDLETAKEYLQAGNYFWNAGIFMFKASIILKEMQVHCPEIIEGLQKADLTGIDTDLYKNLPSVSIDYAVMEKTDNIALIPMDCGWNDLGSWEAVYDVLEKNMENNIIKGDVIAINTNNCYIHSSSRQISAIGLNNLIIVETKDAVLVCDKNKTQDVKTVFEKLKQSNNQLYLKH